MHTLTTSSKFSSAGANLVLSFVDASLLFQPVTERGCAAPETTLLDDLPKPGLGTDGGFFALTSRLPKTDVIHQLTVGKGFNCKSGR